MLDKNVKVAIVHDYLNQRGGAERVVAALHEMFPASPIFTSIVDHENLWQGLMEADIRPSWMQGLPGLKRHFKKYLLLYPKAFESMRLAGYDIILSSSSAFAKGVAKGPGALHICYCYTPMRFVWDYERYVEKEEFGALTKKALPFFIKRLKEWDLKTKDRPDYYIAISSVVSKRIKEYYGRDSTIIFPPVETDKFKPSGKAEDFYLVVSRLNPYKRIDLAVEAFNALGLPLKIIGEGPHKKALTKAAHKNIEFLGRLPDNDVADFYSRCRALVFPGEEDFGIAPLEANAAGRPVIAYRAGGALDTVVEGGNGIFFNEQSPASLIEAVRKMEEGMNSFDPLKVREHALKFDKKVFMEKLAAFIRDKYALHLSRTLKAEVKNG